VGEQFQVLDSGKKERKGVESRASRGQLAVLEFRNGEDSLNSGASQHIEETVLFGGKDG